MIILVASLGVAGFNILGNSKFQTTVTAETFNAGTSPATINLKNTGLVNGSERIYNATYTFTSQAGNYSFNEPGGQIITDAGTLLINNQNYFIDYKYSTTPDTVKTLVTVVIALMAALAVIILVLRAAYILK